ncbi:Dyp-type peroxidase [Bradyrhizobium guangxiense]
MRQIEQDVAAFDRFREANGQHICNKMMGRQDNGWPLAWKYDPSTPKTDSELDTFRYRVDDANGFICPKGAHIRRVNPRDTLGVDVQSSIKSTKLHRLLRRGRPYREDSNGETRKGIFFIACNADLERQFEFVQQRWARNPSFVNLHADDPLVGSSDPQTFPKTLSLPGLPSGGEVSLANFTTTLGEATSSCRDLRRSNSSSVRRGLQSSRHRRWPKLRPPESCEVGPQSCGSDAASPCASMRSQPEGARRCCGRKRAL